MKAWELRCVLREEEEGLFPDVLLMTWHFTRTLALRAAVDCAFTMLPYKPLRAFPTPTPNRALAQNTPIPR